MENELLKNKKFKILTVCQYGYPEPYPSLNHVAELVNRGHTVDAVIGMPNYPMGYIYDGYDNKNVCVEYYKNIKIMHVPIVPRKNNILTRFINYYSFPISANKYLNTIGDIYDIVFVNQTSPIMMVEPAIKYAKKYNKKVIMHCMDLWPASLVLGGIKENSLIYKYYHKVSEKIYNSVDYIFITSKMFKEYLVNEFGINEKRIGYLPQFASNIFENQYINKNDDKTTLDFVFAGNIGKAQNLYVILKTAKLIKNMNLVLNNKKIMFHIVGDGQELDNVINFSKKENLDNVIFYGRKPVEEMPMFYDMADAMIVSLINDKNISYTLPAKVQSYMSYSKPILGSGNGEVNNIINEACCGLCAKANDENDLLEKIIEFSKSDISKFEYNSRKYYEEWFDKDKIIDKFETLLYELI